MLAAYFSRLAVRDRLIAQGHHLGRGHFDHPHDGDVAEPKSGPQRAADRTAQPGASAVRVAG